MGAVIGRASEPHSVPHEAAAAAAPREYDSNILEAAKHAARMRKKDDFDDHNEPIVWGANDGEALHDSLASDAGLGGAPVRLVDARFIIKLAISGGRLTRRQDLPNGAFIGLRQLRQMGKGYMKTDLRILCVSHMWLRPDHPDPRGDSLQLLANALETFVLDRFDGGTWAVFLDYCSLPQCGPLGEARTSTESALLARGLHSLAALFSHPCTWTLKLTKLPVDYPSAFSYAADIAPNVAEYDERGWCWTESSVSNLVKPYTQVLDLSKYSGQPTAVRSTTLRNSTLRMNYATTLPELIRTCRAGRAPPLIPSEFDRLLEQKAFTWRHADLPTVRQLYRSAFDLRFAAASILSFVDLGWNDEDARSLCKVIDSGALRHTREIDLVGNHITDDGMGWLAASLAQAAVVAPNLEAVHLSCNRASEQATAAVSAMLRASQRTRAAAAAT